MDYLKSEVWIIKTEQQHSTILTKNARQLFKFRFEIIESVSLLSTPALFHKKHIHTHMYAPFH